MITFRVVSCAKSKKAEEARKAEEAKKAAEAKKAEDARKAAEAKRFDPNEFSIRWEGTVFAPETGDYEFLVRCDHAARLWVNGLREPLIDAWVKSGNDTDYKASIHLLGGRMYPIQLEFSKAKQGVDDSAKQKSKPESKPATIRLCWKPPHGIDEPIPARCFSQSKLPARFVLTTHFPPDDRSIGYERGNAISRAWDIATTDAALEVANYVAEHRVELAGVKEQRRAFVRSPSVTNSRNSGALSTNALTS